MIESGDKADSPLFDNSDKTVVEETQGNYFYNKYLTDVSEQNTWTNDSPSCLNFSFPKSFSLFGYHFHHGPPFKIQNLLPNTYITTP